MNFLSASLLLASSVLHAGAPEALDAKLLAAAKEDSRLIANLTHLCDTIGPRLTGSENLKRANEWAAEKMKSYGLENVRLEPWTIPEGWQRGPAAARIIEPDIGVSLSLSSWGWMPGTNGKVQGNVVTIDVDNVKELSKYAGKLRGAIILSGPPAKLVPLDKVNESGGSPGVAYVPGKLAKRPFEEIRAFLNAQREFLIREGAVALLSDAGKHFGLLFTRGGWSGTDRPSGANRMPTLSVAHNHYELLYRLAGRPDPARTRMELEVQNTFIAGPLPVYNTVGEIRGAEKPDEYVVVGGHLDSWDLGQGATDNGTGCSVVLETARILARCGVQPKRTIRFILFSGEEQGLHGSAAFVSQHKEEVTRTSACLIHDTGTGKVTGIGCGGWPKLQPILEREFACLKEHGVADFKTRSYSGSDHTSFARAGVPGFLFIQEVAGYRFSHHSQADTLDRAVEENLIQGAQVMAVAAMRIANLDTLLPRQKD